MLSNIVVVDISDVSAGFQMKKAWKLQTFWTLMRFKVFTAIIIVFFIFLGFGTVLIC
jgi:hypothetical protein